VWASSIALARHVEELELSTTGGYWRGKRVLELGAGEAHVSGRGATVGTDLGDLTSNAHRAGCGLVGLVLACLGADVILTDLPLLVPLTYTHPVCGCIRIKQ
jgi:hypothetical protein